MTSILFRTLVLHGAGRVNYKALPCESCDLAQFSILDAFIVAFNILYQYIVCIILLLNCVTPLYDVSKCN